MILMYTIVQVMVRVDYKNLLTIRTVTKTRVHNYKIYKVHATRLSRKNNFAQKCVNDWNSLPMEVVNAPSINTFKNRLDSHWLEHHYDIPS